MEPSATERDLEELETRIERLRALYEQYFMGIERLEPQIPRKEVERRIHLLRKEQIRNTALRFKFQMLIQRYNTLQQYWARVTREIESGTYRRDVLRAAARFGEKEALTILGKKRAKQYAALAGAQAQLKSKAAGADLEEEEEVELDAEDFIDDDETAASNAEEDLGEPAGFLPLITPDVAAPGHARRSGVGPPPLPPPLLAAPTARAAPSAPAPAPLLRPSRLPPPPVLPATPGLGGLRWGPVPRRASVLPPSLDALTNAAPAVQPTAPAEAPGAATSSDPKSAVRPAEATTDAVVSRPLVKRRVAELAAAMRPSSAQSGSAAVAARSFDALDLDLEESRPGGQAVKAPPPPQLSLEGEASPAARPSSLAAKRPLSARVAEAAPSHPAVKAAEDSLGEQRIRQIYAKYVETKRTANESTAGVTYEKLAATLRAQTRRLRESHPTKTVDYEVVVKDGKTQLKPILR